MVAITRIEAHGRFSRSGRTFFIHRLKITVESNRHTYEYDCVRDAEGRMTCSLFIDGRHEDIVVDPPIVKEAIPIIETHLNTEHVDISENRVVIEMARKPHYIEVVRGYRLL